METRTEFLHLLLFLIHGISVAAQSTDFIYAISCLQTGLMFCKMYTVHLVLHKLLSTALGFFFTMFWKDLTDISI